MLNQKEKLIHFMAKKKPKTRLVYKNENKVFLFIKNETRLKILDYSQAKLKKIFKIHVQTLLFDSELKSNLLIYHHKKILTDNEKRTICRFIRYLIQKKFNFDINFKLADYKQVWQAEKSYLESEFVKGLSNCLKTKEPYITPPLLKKTRKRLQEIAMYYSSLKRNTKNCVAGKQVIITHKSS